MSRIEEERKLLKQLEEMKELMISNATYLKKLYPELGHDVELLGAAKITQTWIDGIEDQPLN
jgi:predicted nuclease with TOPRIM domain